MGVVYAALRCIHRLGWMHNDFVDHSKTLRDLIWSHDGPPVIIDFVTAQTHNCNDPSLLRPGRIDRKVAYGLAIRDQAQSLFIHFFPESQFLSIGKDEANATPTIFSRGQQAALRSLRTLWLMPRMLYRGRG
ncbi:hypothetical protein B0H13DRAFT_1929402 [Mycena leptocephala]|nr:hypothetical protein B0H13DRAFT_1929402 [Mycena leptocephala]